MRLARFGVIVSILSILSLGFLALPASAGASDSAFSISPTALYFGNVTVGQTRSLVLTVTLDTGDEVNFTGGNANFGEAQTGCLAVPHFFGPGSCEMTVEFDPSGAGMFNDVELIGESGDTTSGLTNIPLNGIGQEPQTIVFNSVASMAADGGTYTPLVSGGASGNPIVLTASPASVCTMATAVEVSFVGAGTCTLTANQAGGAYYLPAAPVQQSFTVEPARTSLVAAPVSVVDSVLGLHVTFSATLAITSPHQVLSGQTIAFAAGSDACDGVTNADGVATCTVSVLALLPLLLSPGYTAVYAGSTDFGASNTSGSLTL